MILDINPEELRAQVTSVEIVSSGPNISPHALGSLFGMRWRYHNRHRKGAVCIWCHRKAYLASGKGLPHISRRIVAFVLGKEHPIVDGKSIGIPSHRTKHGLDLVKPLLRLIQRGLRIIAGQTAQNKIAVFRHTNQKDLLMTEQDFVAGGRLVESW